MKELLKQLKSAFSTAVLMQLLHKNQMDLKAMLHTITIELDRHQLKTVANNHALA